ncbi:MAG: hypothetical protein M1837_001496 [Sclerophora amabilis]|nr:MAG: hypothetical protein M1837_001496 [Sclerophora amabilis]
MDGFRHANMGGYLGFIRASIPSYLRWSPETDDRPRIALVHRTGSRPLYEWKPLRPSSSTASSPHRRNKALRRPLVGDKRDRLPLLRRYICTRHRPDGLTLPATGIPTSFDPHCCLLGHLLLRERSSETCSSHLAFVENCRPSLRADLELLAAPASPGTRAERSGRSHQEDPRLHLGDSSIDFDLASEAPQDQYTPLTSDHPPATTSSDPSTFPEASAPTSPPAATISSEAVPSSNHQPLQPTTAASSSRRRRRRSSSTSLDDPSADDPSLSARIDLINSDTAAGTGLENAPRGHPHPSPSLHGERRPAQPHRKRRRLAGTMRLDNESTTPQSTPSRAVSNGSRLSPLHKAALSNSTNGNLHLPANSNGSPPAHTNGSSPTLSPSSQPDFFGHDREEVIRILIQSLSDLGYNGAALTLSRESGYDLESPSVAAFRNSVLQGEWGEAESLLFGNYTSDGGGGGVYLENGGSNGFGGGLVLAEGANRKEILFWMRQQKFLELLEERDLGSALMVLRQELTPLNQDIAKLHALSSLVMCQSAEDLKAQAEWDGAAGQSRHALLSELSKSISPSVMVPENRLATLLQQVKRSQISNCLYHNTAKSPSLYSDHMCDRSVFPTRTLLELEQHSDEVWFLEFSHDGSRLATASKDRTVIIYDVPSFETIHTLSKHGEAVAFVAWSPDDTKLISCSRDYKARLWDTHSGKCLHVIDQHNEPVTACAWAPDGLSFVTGSLDRTTQLCVWDLDCKKLHSWPGGFRVQDCSITPDGQRLVVAGTERKVYVFDYNTREEEYSMTLNVEITCVGITQDSRYMLVNMSDNEIRLLDIETAEPVQKYTGQQQGNYVIRGGFGGAEENFVISGSEDSKIYVWHKENGILLETLEGHGSGCVNAVAWNPQDPGMFASAGDDHKVRIWSRAISSSGKWRDSSNGINRL